MLSKIDFLSPPITLFHLERRTHTSKVGGFLVLLMLLICLSYISILLSDFINHRNITTVFHKKFEFEAGYYSFNSSSIFHFIQIFSPENGGYFDKFESKYIRAYTTYVHSNFSYDNLDLYDHWVFDECQKKIIDKDLEPYLFDNIENFTNGVCIRYYYNSTERKYYRLEEKGFLWPHLEHGIAQKNNIYLTTIIQKCSNDSIINEIFGKCPSQKDIDDYLNKYFGIYFYFTDVQVDPTNYSNPVQKYFQVISTGIGNSNNFVESYIHFSPLRVRTYLGSIMGRKIKDINLFSFDMNRKGSANNNEKYYIISKYYHLMQNTVQIYERKYNNIIDILAEIGGVIQFIFYTLYWINFVYNKYIIAYDTNSLFFSVSGDKPILQENKKKNIKLNQFKRKSIKDIPNIQNVKIINQQYINNINKTNDKIEVQNNFGINDGNKKEKINNDIFKRLSNKENRILNINDNSSYLLYQGNKNIIDNFQNMNNSQLENFKAKYKKIKRSRSLKQDIVKRITLSKKNLNKISFKKKESIQISDTELKSIKYFSYIDFLKTLMFKKEKESYNFIRIFRKHLLSEEHLFKSHIKVIFLEKQHKFTDEEQIKPLECFNEL